jgi:hypothetical protein
LFYTYHDKGSKIHIKFPKDSFVELPLMMLKMQQKSPIENFHKKTSSKFTPILPYILFSTWTSLVMTSFRNAVKCNLVIAFEILSLVLNEKLNKI